MEFKIFRRIFHHFAFSSTNFPLFVPYTFDAHCIPQVLNCETNSYYLSLFNGKFCFHVNILSISQNRDERKFLSSFRVLNFFPILGDDTRCTMQRSFQSEATRKQPLFTQFKKLIIDDPRLPRHHENRAYYLLASLGRDYKCEKLAEPFAKVAYRLTIHELIPD